MAMRIWPVAVAVVCLLCPRAMAAELSVGDLRLRPRTSGGITVSGKIDGESTFGWTIMLELKRRPGSRGTLRFTQTETPPAEQRPTVSIRKFSGQLDAVQIEQPHRGDVDIRQLEDVWPGVGTFTPFDTYKAGSPRLNGAVDENGVFVSSSVTYSGVLALFPVRASANAHGVWDVVLRTSAGASGWEGTDTKLISGTITVDQRVCTSGRQCDDRDSCTMDRCEAGRCVHRRSDDACRASKAKRVKRRRRN